MHSIGLLYTLLALIVLLLVALLVVLNTVLKDLATLQTDMSAVRRTFVPPSAAQVGGRAIPSPADIAMARARAPTLQGLVPGGGPNQVDTSGTAQVGGPPQT